MAWITPKTDWTAANGLAAADMNRIEGNTNHLKGLVDKVTYDFSDITTPAVSTDIRLYVTASRPLYRVYVGSTENFSNLTNVPITGNIIITVTGGIYSANNLYYATLICREMLGGKIFTCTVYNNTSVTAWVNDADTVDGLHSTDIVRVLNLGALTTAQVNTVTWPYNYEIDIPDGSSIGLPGTYYHIKHQRHTAYSSGYAAQTAKSFYETSEYIRTGNGTTWTAWTKVTGYSDTLTTALNLKGIDATVRIVARSNMDIINNPNWGYPYVTTVNPGTSVGLPGANWYHIMYFRHYDNNGYGAQMAIGLDAGNVMYIRTSVAGSWLGWRRVTPQYSTALPGALAEGEVYYVYE
jgi:hypothetical protein